MLHNPCAVVPVFDHERRVARVVDAIRAAGLPCILVDDGSGPSCAAMLDRLAAADPAILLMRLPHNCGKGRAVSTGMRCAARLGYTHALQIDADGQHALDDIPAFLALSASLPAAVVCGRPVFGRDISFSRRAGRWVTNIWVWIHTMSLDIPDAMCGFRVYPVAPVVTEIAHSGVSARMGFDIEILVRLHWRGVPMRWIDTAVVYPPDGVSHFRLWSDNVLISWTHTRLFFGMLRRLPLLLSRKVHGLGI